jgi:pimeloyl-ACP methyl ester carboxylesterase
MATTDIQAFHTSPAGAGPRGAIVFIHGFQGDIAATWGNFPTLLAADPRLAGWDMYGFRYSTRLLPDIVGLWRADAPLTELALLLHTSVENSVLRDAASLVLIAHSMGGLIVQRAVLTYPALRQRVTHLFLFGTPSAGLGKASPFFFWKRQFRDMAEDSPFIHQLRHDWQQQIGEPPPFDFLVTAGELDQFVPPWSSLQPFPEARRRVVPGDHVSMIKPTTATSRCVELIGRRLTHRAEEAGPASALLVAVESQQFQAAIDRWWPHRAALDDDATVQLALALESVGRQQDAIDLLEAYMQRQQRPATDALGVLAGRLKRRWLVERRRQDAERALALYRRGYDAAAQEGNHDQAFYLGINVAFMELAYGHDHHAARAIATAVLQHCHSATNPQQRLWRLATEAEAALVLGQLAAAYNAYGQAVAEGPEPWQVRSMQAQAIRMADLVGADDAFIERLQGVFRGETP